MVKDKKETWLDYLDGVNVCEVKNVPKFVKVERQQLYSPVTASQKASPEKSLLPLARS